ncbi:MAG: efflux RND transporter permease subunit, partial [Acidobacteriota bacterium]
MALQLARARLAHPDVATVGTYIGRNAPRFYYNLLSQPNSPHRAMLLAEARSIDVIEETLDWVRDYVQRELPEVSLVAQRLAQGPPLDAPIDIRVVGHDLGDMELVADRLLGELQKIEGTRDVRHDLGLGVPTVRFEIDDAAASRYGVSRAEVAGALSGRTLGLEIGQYRVGEDPVPILVRSSAGQDLPAADLSTLDITAAGGEPIPLAELASVEVEWLPAAIYRKERSRVVHVQAQLAEGRTVYAALADLQPALDALEAEMPAGVRLEMGGELEESGKANAAIASKLPLGLLLLLFFLLLEFNSFRRVGIILMTVPLAAVGVVPGLILTGNPFGFMSMLGVISLIGIVVNNAIVLIDVIESRRRAGSSLERALEEAVERRTRPILLTMATTIAGLSPLAFSQATLWPPLAWAMISGLMASTVLTLLVIPALYRLLFTRPNWRVLGRFGGRRAAAASTAGAVLFALAALLLPSGPALSAQPAVSVALESAPQVAEEVSLEAAMARAMSRPAGQAEAEQAEAARSASMAAKRAAWWPSLGASGDVVRRDRDFEFETPLGSFSLGERTSSSLVFQVTQPLFVPSAQLYASPAAQERADAALWGSRRAQQQLAVGAAEAWLAVLGVEAQARATEAFTTSLGARLREMEARVEAGRVLESESLKVRLDLESAELDQIRLRASREVATHDLGRAIGARAPASPLWQGAYDREGEPSLEDALA